MGVLCVWGKMQWLWQNHKNQIKKPQAHVTCTEKEREENWTVKLHRITAIRLIFHEVFHAHCTVIQRNSIWKRWNSMETGNISTTQTRTKRSDKSLAFGTKQNGCLPFKSDRARKIKWERERERMRGSKSFSKWFCFRMLNLCGVWLVVYQVC